MSEMKLIFKYMHSNTLRQASSMWKSAFFHFCTRICNPLVSLSKWYCDGHYYVSHIPESFFAIFRRFQSRLWFNFFRKSDEFRLVGLWKTLYRFNGDVSSFKFFKNLPSKYIHQLNTFNECTWLCREQLLDGVHFLQKFVDIKRPAMRAVLWGGFGTGKTLTLQQLIHGAYLNGFVLFTVRNAMEFLRCREVHMSVHKEGRINTPSCAVELLQNFKIQNQHMWKVLSGLPTEKTYLWSKIEATESGKPITDIIEIGISAPYLATDCVSALAKELRRHATLGAIKLFVGIDHANSLYGMKTTIKKPNRTKAVPEEISLTYNLRKFFSDNWTNGACVLIADKAELSDARDQVTIPIDTPLELFGEEGFDAIDPFIPIETKLYTLDETNAIYEYYKDKNWLTSEGARSDEGRKQLAYLSGFNPYYYERLCAFN